MKYWLVAIICAHLLGCASPEDDRPQLLSVTERKQLRAVAKDNCTTAVMKDLTARTWGVHRQIEYCNCASARTVETITVQEIKRFSQGETEVITAHNNAVTQYCMEQLLKVWLPPYLAEDDVARGLRPTPGSVRSGTYTAEDIERVVRKHNLYFSGPAP